MLGSLAAFGGAPPPQTGTAKPATPMRWTSNDGRVLEAGFVRVEGANVILSIGGKETPVPLSRLSPQSAAAARAMADAFARKGAIVFPMVVFGGARVEEVAEYFRMKSRDLDTQEPDPAKRGVQIVLDLTNKLPGQPKDCLDMDLSNVTLADAIRFTCLLGNLQISTVENSLWLTRSATLLPPPPQMPPSARVQRMTAAVLPVALFNDATLYEAVEYVRMRSRDVKGKKDSLPLLIAPLLEGESYGHISLDLKNVSISTVLAAIARQAGAEMICVGDALYLKPRDPRSTTAAASSTPPAPGVGTTAEAPQPPRGAPETSAGPGNRKLPPVYQDLKTPAFERISPPKEASESELRRYARAVMSSFYNIGGGEEERTGAAEQLKLLTDLKRGNLDIIIDEHSRIEKARTNPRIDDYTFIKAVAALAVDEDKPLILRCFQDNIILADVIVTKGWQEDAASAFVEHLSHYSLLRAGYGIPEIQFIKACFMSKTPTVTDALAALVVDPSFKSLDGLLLNMNTKQIDPGVVKSVWARMAHSKNVSFRMAATAMAVGDVTALEAVAGYLKSAKDVDLPSPRGTMDNFMARTCGNALLKVVDAPPGKAADVGQWVQERIDKLAWDGASGKYAVRP